METHTLYFTVHALSNSIYADLIAAAAAAAEMPPPGVCVNIMEARRHRRDGRGSLCNPQRFLEQDYQQLKKQYGLFRRRRARLIDDMFPPDDTSIGPGVLTPGDLARVVWKRPRVRDIMD